MIDHVNYQVPVDAVHSEAMTEFMALLGLKEIPPNEALDAQYVVRWWMCPTTGMRVHVVGAGDHPRRQGLGHLCVVLDPTRWQQCHESDFLIRYNPDSPMKRLWLTGPGELRVEVQRSE